MQMIFLHIMVFCSLNVNMLYCFLVASILVHHFSYGIEARSKCEDESLLHEQNRCFYYGRTSGLGLGKQRTGVSKSEHMHSDNY